MNIPKQYVEYFEQIEAGKNIELRDAQTKIVVRSLKDSQKVKVDGGIIHDSSNGIRKSDYAITEVPEGNFYLMELKGAVIDEALKQLCITVENIEQSSELKGLLANRDKLVACVVSPNRQQIPRGVNSSEKALAKKLYGKSKQKPQDMFKLIYYIRVVPKQDVPSINKITRQVVCSNRNPLVINELD